MREKSKIKTLIVFLRVDVECALGKEPNNNSQLPTGGKV
jgi:hypothetical protein